MSPTGNTGPIGYSAQASPAYQAPGSQWQNMQTQGQSTMLATPPAQMGSVTNTIAGQSTPHAFVGRGHFLENYAWLLPNNYMHAQAMRSAIREILSQRNFQHMQLNTEVLRESGHWPEEREYITMQRGVATVFVYVAPAGQDLYLSRATTVQLSFDPIRVIIFICLICEILFAPSIIQSILTNMFTSAVNNPPSVGNPSATFGLALPILILMYVFAQLYVPSIIVMIAFLIASVKYWFAERDFWFYLRRSTLHDFEVDDVKLLAIAVDQAVYAAGDQIKIDVTKLGPPPQGYQTKRRVRVF